MTPKNRFALAAVFATATSLLPAALTQDISHRKSALTVQVQSPSGTPIPGAEIEIEMLNHAFRFGASVEAGHIEPGNGQYDEWTATEIEKYFNSLTYGNIMKWSYFEDRTPERMLEIAALADAYKAFGGPDDMRLRGHATIWGASYQVPNDVRSSDDQQFIRDRIIGHIEDYHATFKDAGIDNFDLYNEHFHERELLIEKVVPSGDMAEEAAEVATWFNKAKEVDPEAELFINDYNMLNADWIANDGAVRQYKAFVDAVRDAGGQIDGIGLQAHMDRLTSKEAIGRRLAILAEPMAPTSNHPEGLPGLKLEITELDINVNSWNGTEEEQALLTENVLTAAFESPSVQGVTIWGMNDYFHWRDNAIMYDDLDDDTGNRVDPVLKQSGQVWIDLVTGEWWEDHSGTTGAQGSFTANTFKGAHRVTVTVNGETKDAVVHLDDPETVTLEFAFTAADASTYDAWADYFEWSTTEDGLRSADPDADGRDNFTEFVDATDPLAADRGRQIRLNPATEDNLDLIFSTRAANSGLAIEVKKSLDLAAWETIATLDALGEVETANAVSTYTLPVSSPADAAFYQVEATEAGH